MKTPTFMKPTKLPSKRVMMGLQKSNQTIADYAKVTPLNAVATNAPVVQMMQAKRPYDG